MTIDLLCPTYRRPERLATMFASAKDAALKPDDVRVWIAVESDDSSHYEKGLHYDYLIRGSWGSAAPAWNWLAKMSHDAGYIKHMTADDLIFKTRGWDALVEGHFCVTPYKVLHYRDDLRDERMALNPFLTRDWIDRIGYIDPYLKHFYSDTWIEDIARSAGALHYDPSIHIQQAHWKNKLAPWDATYERTRSGDWHRQDTARWAETTNLRKELAERIAHASRGL